MVRISLLQVLWKPLPFTRSSDELNWCAIGSWMLWRTMRMKQSGGSCALAISMEVPGLGSNRSVHSSSSAHCSVSNMRTEIL